jgi:hypothetical protein
MSWSRHQCPPSGRRGGFPGQEKAPRQLPYPVARGGMKPLAIWLVPGGEGLTHPMRTPSPRREGHSVDPFGSASTISASAIGAMRMKSRSVGDKDSAAEDGLMRRVLQSEKPRGCSSCSLSVGSDDGPEGARPLAGDPWRESTQSGCTRARKSAPADGGEERSRNATGSSLRTLRSTGWVDEDGNPHAFHPPGQRWIFKFDSRVTA